jgi:histidinol dehydrogenase
MILKIFKYNKKNSRASLNAFLNKRKSFQNNQTPAVNKIIKSVKRNGDKAVINYEKKYSKIKTKSPKIYFSNEEINNISKN